MRAFCTSFLYLALAIVELFANIIPWNDSSNINITTSKTQQSSSEHLSLAVIVEVQRQLQQNANEAAPFSSTIRATIEEKQDDNLRRRTPPTSFTAQQTTTKISHLRRNPSIPQQTPPPPSRNLTNNPTCVFLGAALGICNSLTPGFITLNPTSQADCLCYSSKTWAPTIFDDAVHNCAGYASTAVPTAYEPLRNLEGFCGVIGSLKEPKSIDVSVTSSTIVAKPTVVENGCQVVERKVRGCAGNIVKLEEFDLKEKARCLCYDWTGLWAGDGFDTNVRVCVERSLENVSKFITPLLNLCANAGAWISNSTIIPIFSSVEVRTTLSRTTATDTELSWDKGPLSSQVTSSMTTRTTITTESTGQSSPSTPPVLPSVTTPNSDALNPSTPTPPSDCSTSPTTPSPSSYSTPPTSSLIPPTTRTIAPRPVPTNYAPHNIREVTGWEVIYISFCCSFVLIFLC